MKIRKYTAVLSILLILSLATFAFARTSVQEDDLGLITGPAAFARYGSLNDAVGTIGGTETTLIINYPLPLTAAVVVPTTLKLEFKGSGSIVFGAFNATINGPMIAGARQIFDYTGAGVATLGDLAAAGGIRLQWWDTDVANGVTPAGAIFQDAIDAMGTLSTDGKKIVLTTGTYRINITQPNFRWDDIIVETDGYVIILNQLAGLYWNRFSNNASRNKFSNFIVQADQTGGAVYGMDIGSGGGVFENIRANAINLGVANFADNTSGFGWGLNQVSIGIRAKNLYATGFEIGFDEVTRGGAFNANDFVCEGCSFGTGNVAFSLDSNGITLDNPRGEDFFDDPAGDSALILNAGQGISINSYYSEGGSNMANNPRGAVDVGVKNYPSVVVGGYATETPDFLAGNAQIFTNNATQISTVFRLHDRRLSYRAESPEDLAWTATGNIDDNVITILGGGSAYADIHAGDRIVITNGAIGPADLTTTVLAKFSGTNRLELAENLGAGIVAQAVVLRSIGGDVAFSNVPAGASGTRQVIGWACANTGNPGIWYSFGSISIINTLPAGGTPSVSAGNIFRTQAGGIITDFLNGVEAQPLTILVRHNGVTIDTTGTNLIGSTADLTVNIGDTLDWLSLDGTTWLLKSIIKANVDNN